MAGPRLGSGSESTWGQAWGDGASTRSGQGLGLRGGEVGAKPPAPEVTGVRISMQGQPPEVEMQNQ